MPSKGILVDHSYGKSRVRVTKVTRHGKVHELKEISVDVALRGDFDETYLTGDNTRIVATDSMKNTVYVLAKKHPIDSIESFAAILARHFVTTYPQVLGADVSITERAWTRLDRNGQPHPHAFVSGGNEVRVCEATSIREDEQIYYTSGLKDLLVLKTTNSAFKGFVADEFRTLADSDDRIFATSIEADWEYDESAAQNASAAQFNERFDSIRKAMIDTFAEHLSLSVQQTQLAMGEAAIVACEALQIIRITLPNQHRIPINLSPFGLENKNEIFVPIDEPFGRIEAVIERK